MVIGLTGPNASGKGEVARLLASLGFTAHSLSDVVREAATEEGLPHTRVNLIAVGNRLRDAGGPGALAARILPRLRDREVVDSIRNPGEVEALRSLSRFVLLGVDAPIALRFARSISRGRLGDGATPEEFARNEQRENSDTRSSQQLQNTLALADAVVLNDGSLADLHRRVREALARLGVSI